MARSQLLAVGVLAAVAVLVCCGTSFVSAPTPRGIAAAATAAGVLVAAPPAFAGEPPSVGEHWYWDVGIGSLHGETASIILLVFFLLVVFSLLGAGGSSRKSA
mmetsp:Transcript_20797/g.67447  ORF Transcript_20797/g.67447 Transcript_20797/m.67447 type:complete len:103 (+) Transcript_20797:93-401(+)